MAALGWLLNLGFAAGDIADPRLTTLAGANRIFTQALPGRSEDVAGSTRSLTPTSRTDCAVPSSNRTFTIPDN